MLKQATTFRPFVRKSVFLAYIATGASYHKIVRVIRTATRQGNDVLNMVLPQLLMAIVTMALLTCVLCLNILWCERPRSSSFRCSSSVFFRSTDFMPTVSFSILALPTTYRLRVGFRKDMLLGKDGFFLLLIPSLIVGTAVLPIVGAFPVAPLLVSWVLAWICLVVTGLAKRLNSIAAFGLLIEEFRGSRILFEAFLTAFLGYTVHDKGHSLSGLGCSQQRGASSCITPILYHKLALQANCEEKWGK